MWHALYVLSNNVPSTSMTHTEFPIEFLSCVAPFQNALKKRDFIQMEYELACEELNRKKNEREHVSNHTHQ